MTVSRIDILDRSAEKAHIWINDVADELGIEDRQHAYRVLRAFLRVLRDHLPIDEVAALAAQLPVFIRGIYYEGWDPTRTPEHSRDVDSFLKRLADDAMLTGETEASLGAAAAARVLRHHVSQGEYESVLGVLPAHLRDLLTNSGNWVKR